jgi:hypothetical protein
MYHENDLSLFMRILAVTGVLVWAAIIWDIWRNGGLPDTLPEQDRERERRLER